MKKRIGSSLLLAMFAWGSAMAGVNSDLNVGSRHSKIYAPNKYDKPALVISLHGIGGGSWWTPGAMQFEAIADTANFIVAYPDGENSQWDLGTTTSNKDVIFVLAIIDSMANRYDIDRNRVYVSGFSMGGMMSWILSCVIPDKIAAIVPGNGYPLYGMSGCSETRHVPAMQIHGNADNFVSYSGFVNSFFPAQRTRYGCPTTAQQTNPYPVGVNGRNADQLARTSKSYLDVYSSCEKNGLKSELSLLTVDGMIHDWATPNKANTNEDSKYTGLPFDVNGTWEAWNFMRRHSLLVSTTPVPPVLTVSTGSQKWVEPAEVSFVVAASDSDGTVSHIDFSANDSLIHSEWVAPYDFVWSAVPAGTYAMKAVAYDDAGNTTTVTWELVVEEVPLSLISERLRLQQGSRSMFDLQGRYLGRVKME